MFVIIGGKKCPNCCIEGTKWRKKPDVFVCNKCNAYYTEFGIVIESQIFEEENRFT